ncbi:hypothetical protein WJX74_000140 [Apatococcus lobatus]|uniref:DNA replication complex GINS protein PSF1 C-terminal domain-containing protein n=1 Tax=Apatococcus lobatus TaxID=904363 RepID=A0AAW1SAP9_9CHLO
MTYVKERAERIKSLKWSSRTAAMSIRPQLSATEVEDTTPPSDPELSVRVRKDCGEVVLPSGTFFLKKDTCHIMPREEAEGLIRDGYVEAFEHDNCLLRWDT